MAEQNANNDSVETNERGCFDFIRKKQEKPQEDLVMKDTNATEEKKQDEKHSLMDELQRTRSQSSSSSDEEVEEGGERKKKKKKGLKDAIKDKFSGDKEGEDAEHNDTFFTVVQGNEEDNGKTIHNHDEKKGFIEKIKEKLPGHQDKKGDEENQIPTASEHSPGNEGKEKKGIIDMIKEKLPGQHKSNGSEVKED